MFVHYKAQWHAEAAAQRSVFFLSFLSCRSVATTGSPGPLLTPALKGVGQGNHGSGGADSETRIPIDEHMAYPDIRTGDPVHNPNSPKSVQLSKVVYSGETALRRQNL